MTRHPKVNVFLFHVTASLHLRKLVCSSVWNTAGDTQVSAAVWGLHLAVGYCRYGSGHQSRGIGCPETQITNCQTIWRLTSQKIEGLSKVSCVTQLPATTHKNLLSYWTHLQSHESCFADVSFSKIDLWYHINIQLIPRFVVLNSCVDESRMNFNP
jgi:hypothetical protein